MKLPNMMTPGLSGRPRATLMALAIFAVLSGCGGGGNDAASASHAGQQGASSAGSQPSSQDATASWLLASEAEVSRLLLQAGFGASPKDLKNLVGKRVSSWIDEQFDKPQTRLLTIVDEWVKTHNLTTPPHIDEMHNAWWYAATQQDDQLRLRVAWALSQIFVISSNAPPGNYTRGMANYYDLLSRNAFGNFRNLLEDVTLSPMMGLYLTHIYNRKENFNNAGQQTSSPDENYAREVMQLFTIGLEMLNPDGSVKRSPVGEPIPTYNNNDIIGLARVLTGWSWAGPNSSNDCFYVIRTCPPTLNPDREIQPMKPYPQYHSTLEKSFLGVTIPEGQVMPAENLKVALDTLFNHPNVGPFIGKQLIQRLVTSNPSPEYVRRVASAFDNNGQGVRGDMKAVIKAILLDPEARRQSASPAAGRIMEPLLRVAHVVRAFETSSANGRWPIGRTDGPSYLNQSTLRSPSVFNFYRPGYTPPNTPVSKAGLLAPEMGILNESSMAGISRYLNDIAGGESRWTIGIGAWHRVPDPANPGKTISQRVLKFNYEPLIERAAQPATLVDYLNTLLAAGQMKADTRKLITDAVAKIEYQRENTPEKARETNLRRAALAAYLTLMSTDSQVLK